MGRCSVFVLDWKGVHIVRYSPLHPPPLHAANAKIPCMGGHPKNIVMLCCDAFGVLPPVAKLTREQAMYYFIRCGTVGTECRLATKCSF